MATRRIRFIAPVIQLTLVSGLFWACGGDDDDSTGTGGKGGSSSAGKGSAGKGSSGKGGSSSAGKGGSGSSGKGGGGTGGSSAGEGGNAGVVESAGSGGSAGNGEGGAGNTSGEAGMSQGGAAPFLSDTCSGCLNDHCAVERTACEASSVCSACLEHSGGNCENSPLFQAVATCACPSACDGGCSTECGDPKFYH